MTRTFARRLHELSSSRAAERTIRSQAHPVRSRGKAPEDEHGSWTSGVEGANDVTEQAKPSGEHVMTAAPTKTKPPIPRNVVYKVVAGDTLSEIATRIVPPKVTLDHLKSINAHLGPPKRDWNKIGVGDKVNTPK
jgi:LysM repeat protein